MWDSFIIRFCKLDFVCDAGDLNWLGIFVLGLAGTAIWMGLMVMWKND